MDYSISNLNQFHSDFKNHFEVFEHHFPMKRYLERYSEEVLILAAQARAIIQMVPHKLLGNEKDLEASLETLKSTKTFTRGEMDNLLARVRSVYEDLFGCEVQKPKHLLILQIIWGEGIKIDFYNNTPIQCALVDFVLENEDIPEGEGILLDSSDRRKVDLIGKNSEFKETFPDIENPSEACRDFTLFLRTPGILCEVSADRLIDIWTLSKFFGAFDGITLCNDELKRKLQDENIDGFDLLKRRYRGFLGQTTSFMQLVELQKKIEDLSGLKEILANSTGSERSLKQPSELHKFLERNLRNFIEDSAFKKCLGEVRVLSIENTFLDTILAKGSVFKSLSCIKLNFVNGRTEEWRFEGKLLPEGRVILPDGQFSEGNFDPATGRLLSGRVSFLNGNVAEGDFNPITGKLIKGKKAFSNGKIEEGNFDPRTSRLLRGVVRFPCGSVVEGDWSITGNLLKGKKNFSNGQIEEGNFDPHTSRLIRGVIRFQSGTVAEGDWSITGKLLKGRLSFLSGNVEEGDFNPLTNQLLKGKKTFSNGNVEEGYFDLTTCELIEGNKIFKNGVFMKGYWDPSQSRLHRGMIKFRNGKTQEGNFDSSTGKLIEGVIILPKGTRKEGVFDPYTGQLLKGKKTFLDGQTHEGVFYPRTGQLVEGKKIFSDNQVQVGNFDPVTGQLLGVDKTFPSDQSDRKSWDLGLRQVVERASSCCCQ